MPETPPEKPISLDNFIHSANLPPEPPPKPEPQPRAERPKRKRGLPWWIALPFAVYLLALGVIAYGNAHGPEHWWWSSFNLYLPQWIWALPGLVLLLATLIWARRWFWLPLLALGWAIGPIMGFCWHFPAATPDASKGIHLRVMTYNIKMANRNVGAIIADIEANKPDVILMQERGGALDRELGRYLAGWNVIPYEQYIIASRLPLTPDMSVSSYRPIAGQCLRCRLQVGPFPVILYTTHLPSPRGGLLALRHEKEVGIGPWEGNVASRLEMAQNLTDAIQQDAGPVLLTGDLNAPVQSMVCQNFFRIGMRDAFSEAGRGFGYSYGSYMPPLKRSYVRIDHILVSSHWQVLNSWPGNEIGSDHRPVFADLFLPFYK